MAGAFIGENVFESAEKVRTKAATTRVGGAEDMSGENLSKEFMGEVAGGIFGTAFALKKGNNGSIVGGAKIAQGQAGALGFAARGQDLSPARRGEVFALTRQDVMSRGEVQ
jgi:hypothetical protein